MVITLGSALGYSLVLIAFSAIRIKLDSQDVPRAFKGLPIAFITAALMSLAFLGFAGLI
jgi:electron transport complex protein RnfA